MRAGSPSSRGPAAGSVGRRPWRSQHEARACWESQSDSKAELEARRLGLSVDEVWARWEAEGPAGRVVSAEEVADVIAFLAGEKASGVNGEAVTVALGAAW